MADSQLLDTVIEAYRGLFDVLSEVEEAGCPCTPESAVGDVVLDGIGGLSSQASDLLEELKASHEAFPDDERAAEVVAQCASHVASTARISEVLRDEGPGSEGPHRAFDEARRIANQILAELREACDSLTEASETHIALLRRQGGSSAPPVEPRDLDCDDPDRQRLQMLRTAAADFAGTVERLRELEPGVAGTTALLVKNILAPQLEAAACGRPEEIAKRYQSYRDAAAMAQAAVVPGLVAAGVPKELAASVGMLCVLGKVRLDRRLDVLKTRAVQRHDLATALALLVYLIPVVVSLLGWVRLSSLKQLRAAAALRDGADGAWTGAAS